MNAIGSYQMLLDLRDSLVSNLDLKNEEIKKSISNINHDLKYVNSFHARSGKAYDLIKSFNSDIWYLSINLKIGKRHFSGLYVFEYKDRVRFIRFISGNKTRFNVEPKRVEG